MLSGIQYSFPASLPWTEKLISKLSERDYRHAYMMEGVKTWIARQVRTLREQRHWSQDDLGRETRKPQSAISRVEDPDYGKLTLQTLFDLAQAYDLPLLVQFVEWGDWLSRMNDVSTEVLQRESFSADLFAMELLMPRAFLLADIEKMGGVDIEDDAAMTKLAKRYKVSITIMAIRLGQLLARGIG